jgi:formylglycine-generating enzyme required for sulfatase activity
LILRAFAMQALLGNYSVVKVLRRILLAFGVLQLVFTNPTNAAEVISNQASANPIVVNGFVIGVTITSGGNGYFVAPPVNILGTGSNATAEASVQNGAVVGIRMSDAGFGYGTNTRVVIGPSSYPDIGGVHLYVGIDLIAQVGSVFEIQTASSLQDPFPWTHLTNVTQSTNPQVFFDTVAAGKAFYRVLPIPTNPSPAQLVWVPPGTFAMGSPLTEPGRNPDEQQHVVSITEGFWMGQREVNQPDYMATMLSNPSEFTGSALPVESVTWQNAVDYCAVLTRREQDAGRLPLGYVYRLPTEAEWEYATRSGSQTAYSFGDDPSSLPQFAWFATNSGSMTDPVVTRTASPPGLFDTYGNVAEWCLDWYGSYSLNRALDPQGPTNGVARVVRGGSWASIATECRSASRDSLTATNSASTVGFRTVLAKETYAWPTNPNPARLVWVPSGSLIMGSPLGELGRGSDETQHQVTLTKAFWISRYELTQGEFSTLTGIQLSGGSNLSAQITWQQATQYCQLLNAQESQAGRLPTGYVYRLPREAEWEYVARAGTQTRYFFGDDLSGTQLANYAWYGGTCGVITIVGGEKAPSPLGLYDIYGNKAEWCADWYGPYPQGSAIDPIGPASGQYKVSRGGGCCCADAAYCRSAARLPFDPNQNGAGLRIVLGQP